MRLKRNVACDELGFCEPEFFEFEGGGGGKGSRPSAPPQKIVAPTPPVEEASVELDDESKKRKPTSKGNLKIPLAEADTAGIRL